MAAFFWQWLRCIVTEAATVKSIPATRSHSAQLATGVSADDNTRATYKMLMTQQIAGQTWCAVIQEPPVCHR